MPVDEKRIKDIRAVTAFALLIAMLVSIFAVSIALRQGHTEYGADFGKIVADGIDVSEHNGEIDWEQVGKEVDFAFIRIAYRGYGTGKMVEDKRAKENFKSANREKIPVGAYFYSQAITEAEAVEEAEFAIKRLRHYDVQLPVVIDFEYALDEENNHIGRLSEAGNSPQENAKIINAFCKVVEDAGYKPGIYASSSVYSNNIDCERLSDSAIIWVADYSGAVSYDISYDIWQYSKSGVCNGVDSNAVDLNYWYTKN